MPSLKSNSFFPITMLGTDTTFSLPYQFMVVEEFPCESSGIKDSTIYVRIDSASMLSYRVSQKNEDDTLQLSSEGHVYHHQKLSLFNRFLKYFESFIRNTRYMGSQEFTPESVTTTGSDLQVTILDAANSKHKPDMPVAYPFGESHSILAMIENNRVKKLGQVILADYRELFDSIDIIFNPDKVRRKQAGMKIPFSVVEGPDTLGHKVGERIAEGLLKSFAAIAAGETKLSYKAHSRGSCEAIILSHELEHILNKIKASPENYRDNPIGSLIQDIECPYTRKALTTLNAYEGTRNDLLKLMSQLILKKDDFENIRVKLSLLDPVPGNSPYLLPGSMKGEWITWNNPKLFEIPKIVEQCLWIGCQNEHTECFAPVLPHPVDPNKTKFQRVEYPGHHGSATGNPFDQQGQANSRDSEGEKTRTIQLIHLLNMLDFEGDETFNAESIGLGYPVLKEAQDYLNATPLERSKLLLDLYEIVQQNRSYYDYFNTTHYAFLRREGTLDPTRISEWFRGRQHRSIFTQETQFKSKAKSTDYLGVRSKHFVNAQHAALYLTDIAKLPFSFASRMIDAEFLVALYEPLKDKPNVDVKRFNEALSILFYTASQYYVEHIQHKDYLLNQLRHCRDLFERLSISTESQGANSRYFSDAANDHLATILNKRLDNLSSLLDIDTDSYNAGAYDVLMDFYKTIQEQPAVSDTNKSLAKELHGFIEMLTVSADGRLVFTEDDDLVRILEIQNRDQYHEYANEILQAFGQLEQLTKELDGLFQCGSSVDALKKPTEQIHHIQLSWNGLLLYVEATRVKLADFEKKYPLLSSGDDERASKTKADLDAKIKSSDALKRDFETRFNRMTIDFDERIKRTHNEEREEFIKQSIQVRAEVVNEYYFSTQEIRERIKLEQDIESEKVLLLSRKVISGQLRDYIADLMAEFKKQNLEVNASNAVDLQVTGHLNFLKAEFIKLLELQDIIKDDSSTSSRSCLTDFYLKLEEIDRRLGAYKNPEWNFFVKALLTLLDCIVKFIPVLGAMVERYQRKQESELDTMKNQFVFFKASLLPLKPPEPLLAPAAV